MLPANPAPTFFILVGCIVSVYPCLPVYAGYFPIPQCRNYIEFQDPIHWTFLEITLRIMVGFFVFVYACTLGGVYSFLTGITAIQSFAVASYMNRVKDILESRNVRQITPIIRRLQVVMSLLNDCYSTYGLTAFLLGTSLLQISMVSSTFTMYQVYTSPNVQIILILLAWGSVITVSLVLFMLGFSSIVYSRGMQLHLSMNAHKDHFRISTRVQKELKTFPILSYRLADNTCLSPLVTIIAHKLTWEYIVSTIIVFSRF